MRRLLAFWGVAIAFVGSQHCGSAETPWKSPTVPHSGTLSILRASWRPPKSMEMAITSNTVVDFRLLARQLGVGAGFEERIDLEWVSPFREDLSPTVSFWQATADATVVVSGSEQAGERARILNALPQDKRPSFFQDTMEFLPSLFLDTRGIQRVHELKWCTPGSLELTSFESDWPQSAQRMASDAQSDDRALASAHWIALTSEGVEYNYLEAMDWIAWIDATAVQAWTFRVLEWQVYQSDDGSTWRFPRTVFCEQATVNLERSVTLSRVRSLAIIDFRSDVDKADWRKILPATRASDYQQMTSAYYECPREECLAWKTILDSSTRVESLKSCLGSYGEQAISKIDGPYSLIDGDLIGSSPKPTPFGIEVVERLITGYVSPVLDTPIDATPVATADSLPDLLSLVSDMRRVEKQPEEPRRAGFVPVSFERRVQSRWTVLLVVFGLLGLTAVLTTILLSPRRKSKGSL